MHVKGEECLVARDAYKAIGYEEEKGKQVIQNLVRHKYKLGFGDLKASLNQLEYIFLLNKDTFLLKEPGLHCFLLRCKKDEAELFMERAVETVLPREVQKSALAIGEKDAALSHRDD